MSCAKEEKVMEKSENVELFGCSKANAGMAPETAHQKTETSVTHG